MGGCRNEERINYALRLYDLGVSIETICRKLGISRRTFYLWKGKRDTVVAAKLKVIEGENRELRQIVSDMGIQERLQPDVADSDPEIPSNQVDI